jgi:hypothetical protein
MIRSRGGGLPKIQSCLTADRQIFMSTPGAILSTLPTQRVWSFHFRTQTHRPRSRQRALPTGRKLSSVLHWGTCLRSLVRGPFARTSLRRRRHAVQVRAQFALKEYVSDSSQRIFGSPMNEDDGQGPSRPAAAVREGPKPDGRETFSWRRSLAGLEFWFFLAAAAVAAASHLRTCH